MSVQLISVKCPECGAELSVEEGREFSFCSYCGTKVLMKNVNDNEHIFRSIDEARIKESETEREIRLKELEIEEKEGTKGRKSSALAYVIALAFGIVGIWLMISESIAGMFCLYIGGIIALFAYVERDSKKKKHAGSNDVLITEGMCEYAERNYNAIVLLYKNAGFTDVTAIPLHDLGPLNIKKNGQVDIVSINGDDCYEENDIFPKNSKVMVTYHCK